MSLKKWYGAASNFIMLIFDLIYFVKCWQMFLELNSKGLYQSSEKKKKKAVVLCAHPGQNALI